MWVQGASSLARSRSSAPGGGPEAEPPSGSRAGSPGAGSEIHWVSETMDEARRSGAWGWVAAVFFLAFVAGCQSESRPPVILVGVDGGSWDLLFQYTRDGGLPHLAKLLESGSGGYLNSLLWRRFERRHRGYFSPIVWTTIATGKRPNQHGIEDFVLPPVQERDFYLMGGPGGGLLDLDLLRPGFLLLDARSNWPDAAVRIEVTLQGRPVGRFEFGGEPRVRLVELPSALVKGGRAQVRLKVVSSGERIPALRIRRLGLLDPSRRLIRWLHPRQDSASMKEGWHFPGGYKPVRASRQHMLARPLWEIAAEHGRKTRVIGWWATWPATADRGEVFSDLVGSSGSDVERDLVAPSGLWPRVERLMGSRERAVKEWRIELADALECDCLGKVQGKLYLEHRWVDELRLRILEEFSTEPADLVAIYLRLVDTASHQFLGLSNPKPLQRCRESPDCNVAKLAGLVEDSYGILDEAIGRIQRVVPADAIWILVTDHGQLAPEGQPGVHQNNGFIVLSGSGIKPGVLYGAQVADIAPTVLYLLNLPVPADMGGRILTQALEPELLSGRPPRYGSSYETLLEALPAAAEAEEESITDRAVEELKALGYVE